MAEADIVQNSIRRLGQSQRERFPRELDAQFVKVDERQPADLLRFAQRLAARVRYYRVANTSTPDGDWTPFFPFDPKSAGTLVGDATGKVAPHLGLYIAFLELYERARAVMNRITGRHLDFFYKEVLGFEPHGPRADRAHVLVELKKNTAPVALSTDHRFTAGKDARGVEMVYAPLRETVVRTASVASLRSVHVDADQRGAVRFAPVANSPDGLGGEWKSADRSWHPFGGPALPLAPIGFAIASPVLRMNEGRRVVTCSLLLGNVDLATVTTASLAGAFETFVTGKKGWLGPYAISPTVATDGRMTFNFVLPESEDAVVDYDPAVHGQTYAAQAPVIQVVLTGNGGLGYAALRALTVRRAKVSVDVSGVTSLTLENDGGGLDPKKAFPPFGPQPATGSRFMVGYPEALSKKLSHLSIRVRWMGVPDFADRYANYGASRTANNLTASISYGHGGTAEVTERFVTLFTPLDDEGGRVFSLAISGTSAARPPASAAPTRKGNQVYALRHSGGNWARHDALRSVLMMPVLVSFLRTLPDSRPGFITFSLDRDFLHARYRKKTIELALSGSQTVLEEPYTPMVESISLSYGANGDDVEVGASNLAGFAQPDAQFFHIGPFGQMREHAYQRSRFEFVAGTAVPLLPAHASEGELLVGVAGLGPRDSLSLLFQVAEGTADPDLPRATILWSVLCDNYWKLLGPSEVTLDTTNQLRTSGLVGVVVPAEATTDNTLMPSGLLWLKAEVSRDVAAACRLVSVAANGVEVEFRDAGNDPDHLRTALPPKKIAKLKTMVAGVKTVDQPYASFGGRMPEIPEALQTRAAERLRHKGRCITAWDYERLVLESFPDVHRVKCIPHAKDGEWLAPGHLLLIVVPDLRNRIVLDPNDREAAAALSGPADPLQPKVDADTVSRITDFVGARAGPQVTVRVKNPTYQKVRLDFKVRFHPGYEFNYYSRLLSRELVRLLSPWAFDEKRPLSFGGRAYRSALLDFVEEREYVDYVTDFKMFSFVGATPGADLAETAAATPDAILVSDREHAIAEAPAAGPGRS